MSRRSGNTPLDPDFRYSTQGPQGLSDDLMLPRFVPQQNEKAPESSPFTFELIPLEEDPSRYHRRTSKHYMVIVRHELVLKILTIPVSRSFDD